MADFHTWEHATLARFAQECQHALEEARAENKALLEAWRKAVATPQAVAAVELEDVAEKQQAIA